MATLTKRRRQCVAVALLVACAGLMLIAGELEPPGPPAPTMKPLDEVEPRIPIRASDLPLTITLPGSYYLVEDTATAGNGITIDSVCVSIDLNGFALFGGTSDAISVTGARDNIEVRNGVVAGWTGHGIDLSSAVNSRVINVRVYNNGGDGIRVGDNSLVKDSVSSFNTLSNIATGLGATVADCVTNQGGAHGIATGTNSVISRCSAWGNAEVGIFTSSGSVVVGCTACENGRDGIDSGASTIEGCTVCFNTENGIRVGEGSFVLNNNANQNGLDTGDGAGILVTGTRNRIEGNNVTENDRGIDVDAAGNLIVRNSAADNTVEYDIVGGNQVGPIGSADTSTSPWANLDY